MFLEPEPYSLMFLLNDELAKDPNLPKFKKTVQRIQKKILDMYLGGKEDPRQHIIEAITTFDFSKLNNDDWRQLNVSLVETTDYEVNRFSRYADIAWDYARVRKHI